MRLLFLCSLPRSGSTLLQRVLSRHPEICTVSEPWILLPFCYALNPKGSYSEYHHQVCSSAILDFVERMPNKSDDYYEELGKFALSLYEKQGCGRPIYFLDKTPRYYLILHLIPKIFPTAKYIFLFRNPIQIMASLIDSWGRGRLRIEDNYIDLYKGPDKLAESYEKLKEKSIAVNFDDFLQRPYQNIHRIFEYLELEYNPSVISDFNEATLEGRMGDKSGYYKYNRLAPHVRDKWKKTFDTRFRKKFLKNYIRKLSPVTLQTFGYSQSQLLREIENIQPKRGGAFPDRLHLLIGALIRLFEIPFYSAKLRERKERVDPFFLHR